MEIKDWIVTHKKTIGLALIGVIVLWYLIGPISRKPNQSIELSESYPLFEASSIPKESEADNGPMYVDIKGAVKAPGMYSVDESMRLVDAIHLAGGFLDQADVNQINLAQKLTDQMVVYVPMEGEELSNDHKTGTILEVEAEQSEKCVNINTATKEELKTLSGVGDKKAENIIRHREEQGSFSEIDDLKKVDGIGDKTFEQLKSLITTS